MTLLPTSFSRQRREKCEGWALGHNFDRLLCLEAALLFI